MKIKIIDLLNMKAKGQKLPKKICIFDEIFVFRENFDNYSTYFDLSGDYLFCDKYDWEENLNTEVEIIEEQPADAGKVLEKLDEKDLYLTENQQKKIVHTLNKIIDKISEMENK